MFSFIIIIIIIFNICFVLLRFVSMAAGIKTYKDCPQEGTSAAVVSKLICAL